MSFKRHEMWSVICDFPDCGRDAQVDSDYVAWADQQQAVNDAEASGDWRHIDGKHLCGEHWHWCENADDDERYGPAKGCCGLKGVIVDDRAMVLDEVAQYPPAEKSPR